MHTRVHQMCTHTARAHTPHTHTCCLTLQPWPLPELQPYPLSPRCREGVSNLIRPKPNCCFYPSNSPPFCPHKRTSPTSQQTAFIHRIAQARSPEATLRAPSLCRTPPSNLQRALTPSPHVSPVHPLPASSSLRPSSAEAALTLGPDAGSSFFLGLWPPLMFSIPSWSGSRRQPKWPWKTQIWSCTLLPQTHHAWKDSWSSSQSRHGGARVPSAPLKLHWPPHLPLCTQPAPPQGLHTSCLGQLPQTGPRSPHHLTRPGPLHHCLRTSSQTTCPKSTACYPVAPPLALLVIFQESVSLPDLEFCTYSFV